MLKQFKKNACMALILGIALNLAMPYLAFPDVTGMSSYASGWDKQNKIEEQRSEEIKQQIADTEAKNKAKKDAEKAKKEADEKAKRDADSAKLSQHLADLIQKLNSHVKSQEQAITKLALKVFYCCIFFEIIWIGIQAAMGRRIKDIADMLRTFVLAVFTASIFLAIIKNYDVFTANIVKFFSEPSGADINKFASALPFTQGLELAQILVKGVESGSWGLYLMMNLIGAIVIVIFALVTLQVIILKVEMLVGVVCSIALVGCGAISYLRQYGISVIKFVATLGLKFMVINIILNVGSGIIKDMGTITNGIGFIDGCVVVATALVLLTMIQKVGALIPGMLSGVHHGSGSGLGGATGTLKSVAMGGLSMATMPFKGASSVASGLTSMTKRFMK